MIAVLALFRAVPTWCYGVLLGVAVILGAEFHGRHTVQAKWDKAKIEQAAADKAAIDIRTESNRILAKAQAATNERIQSENNAAIVTIETKYASVKHDIARVGLRYTVASNATGAAQANSASRDNATATSTIELPNAITSDLLALAHDADKVVEQARSCQDWVRSNGFAP
jgi:hypothetical protein